MKYFISQSLLLLAFFSIMPSAFAQDWLGFHSSNYAGINGVHAQPASLADSRYKFQMNIIGFSSTVSNNYLSLDNDVFQDFKFSDIKREDFLESSRGSDKGIYGNLHVMLPSFMVTLSPKHAFGFAIRTRAIVNVDNINNDVADFIDEWEQNGEITINPNEQFNVSDLYAQAQLWAEYGITYSRVVIDDGPTFLKAGATVKLLQGLASGYGYVDQLDYRGLRGNNIDVLDLDVRSGYSDFIDIDDFDEDNFEDEIRDRLSLGRSALGFDIGVEYEHRPNHEQYKRDLDGDEGIWKREKNKYKYKVGFAILDIGSMKYDRSQNSGRVTGSTDDLSINDLNDNQDVDEIIDSLFVLERGGSYRMSLPTTISGQFDYHISGGMYVNFTSQIALRGGTRDEEKSRHLTTLSLSPRVENKNVGLALPLSYDKFSNFNAGATVRLGPLVIGSRNILSAFLGKDLNMADMHFALRWGLPYRKPRDRDNDGISNKYDYCERTPGLWEFDGCPDTDGDGIQDSKDRCPQVAGVEAFNGCPDTDEDGIQDSEDACPNVAGPAALQGCPDRDEDGITDAEDACPDIAGPKSLNGCPDRDEDGVMDSEDQCPDLAGPKEKNGCPDSDGDGIYDNDDKCPQQPGIIENGGCPYADTDGDGVIDKEDDCPATPGVPENKGCPVLEKEEQEIINTAFDNLEFKTGSSIIASSSYISLDELAKLMRDKPTWTLVLEGHTDSSGSRSGNMRLSKTRAQAVADYISQRGVAADRLTVFGYGPDRPIANNNTASGRQKNRRVEMNIKFE